MAVSGKHRSEEFVYSLVEEIAEASGVDPMELEPLSETVNIDALAALLSNAKSDDLSVSFTYAGQEVSVAATGEIEIV